MKVLLGLNTDELCTLVQDFGEPAYRGKPLAVWLYEYGAHRYEDMTSLPDKLRAHLSWSTRLAALKSRLSSTAGMDELARFCNPAECL
jgi:23S rRNA (adenine2503-C2)-methyltransferase